MNSQYLVSVVINCHNSEEFLREAIESVFDQTYNNWELIFWDNNSSDSSAEIAKSYGERVRYIYNPDTLSLGEARHEAVKECKGKYLAFLDCDDLWYSDKLEKQIALIGSNNDIGFVYGRANVLFEDSKKIALLGNKRTLPEGRIFSELIKEDFIPFPSALIDIEKFWEIGGFPKHFVNSPDYWIFLHLSKSYKVMALQDPCCIYRLHSNNLSKKQIIISTLESIELVEKFLPSKEAESGLKYHKVTLCFGYLRTKDYLKFFKLLSQVSWTIFFTRVFKKIIYTLRLWT